MSEPFIGEIAAFGFDFAPRGWALCNGQLLPINQNQALFSLLGTMYGGDGRTTFGLPDLRGRVPVHVGNLHVQGETGGEEAHTLVVTELPTHNHPVQASSLAADQANPVNHLWANGNVPAYAGTPNGTLAVGATLPAGGSQPHNNLPPFLTVNYCIALVGIFPSRN